MKRITTLAVLGLVALVPSATAQAKTTPSGSGSPAPAQVTLTAPYGAAWTSLPEQYGLSAVRGTGRLLADPWPDITVCAPYCAYGVRQGTAWIGADVPSGTWRTVTVTFLVTRAHAKETIDPFFQAYFMLDRGQKLAGQGFDGPSGFYCGGQAIFREGDSTAGLNATVTGREYTLTCPISGGSVWAGVVLRAYGAAPIELDATVRSIVVR